MIVEFLGTAGGVPSLFDSVSQHKDVPIRTSPGLFIHDLKLLIDSSEDIFYQLRQAKIADIKYGIYSHWHPDHTMGLRIWETLNFDFVNTIPQSKVTTIYLTSQEVEDFKTYFGHWNHLLYLQQIGVVELKIVSNNAKITIKDTTIEWIQLSEKIAFGFYITTPTKRLLIIPDEIKGFQPINKVKDVDVAILPFGSNEVNPVTKERIHEEGMLSTLGEATFEECVEIAKNINAKHTYFTHIEATESLTQLQAKKLERQLSEAGISSTIAYDGLKIKV